MIFNYAKLFYGSKLPKKIFCRLSLPQDLMILSSTLYFDPSLCDGQRLKTVNVKEDERNQIDL